jgi:hypothetical protein
LEPERKIQISHKVTLDLAIEIVKKISILFFRYILGLLFYFMSKILNRTGPMARGVTVDTRG